MDARNGRDPEVWLEEREAYESRNHMTPDEKRAFRRWLSRGHDIDEPCAPRYTPDDGNMTFIEAYREDQWIREELAYRTPEKQRAFMYSLLGKPGEDSPDDFYQRNDQT